MLGQLVAHHALVRREHLVHRRLELVHQIIRKWLGECHDVRRVSRYVLQNFLGLPSLRICERAREEYDCCNSERGDSSGWIHDCSFLSMTPVRDTTASPLQ